MKRAIVLACIGILLLLAITVKVAAQSSGGPQGKSKPGNGGSGGQGIVDESKDQVDPPQTDETPQAPRSWDPQSNRRGGPGTEPGTREPNAGPGSGIPQGGGSYEGEGCNVPPPSGGGHKMEDPNLGHSNDFKGYEGEDYEYDGGGDTPQGPGGDGYVAPVLSANHLTPPNRGNTVEMILRSRGDQYDGYLLMASKGTEPGILLDDGRTLPLNADQAFFFSLDPRLTYIFQNFIGNLDVNGTAKAYFYIPDIFWYEGITLYFCFVTLDSSFPYPGVKKISNVLPMTIL